MKRIIYRQGETLTVLYKGTTANDKIAQAGEVIIQSSHYSRQQFDVAQRKTSMREFFGHDKAVCMDCPFSMAAGADLKGCYTHKMNQYTGMLSQLRSIGRTYASFDDIPELTDAMVQQAAEMSTGLFVRFGTYGEPSLMPIPLIEAIVAVAKNWTGYTHQWRRLPEYAKYFMASTHNPEQVRQGELIGYRSFIESSHQDVIQQYVNCPASKEQGYKSNCSKCGLCSGTAGKGSRHISIFNHS